MAFLTMRSKRVATDGNSFGVFLRFLRLCDLRPFATVCNQVAPYRLHPW
jgi:hypothetical protein